MAPPSFRMSFLLCLFLWTSTVVQGVEFTYRELMTQSGPEIASEREEEFRRFLRRNDSEGADASMMDISELQITDERDARAFCSLAFRIAKGFVASSVPFSFDCKCSVPIVIPWVILNCEASITTNDIEDITGEDLAEFEVPVKNDFSVSASARGRFVAARRQFKRVRISTSSFRVETEDPFTQDALFLDIPSTEFRFGTKIGFQPMRLRRCRLTIGGDDCNCEVCNRDQGIRMTCKEKIEAIIPEQYQNFTEGTLDEFLDGCIELDFLRDDDQRARLPSVGNVQWLAPFLIWPAWI